MEINLTDKTDAALLDEVRHGARLLIACSAFQLLPNADKIVS